MGIVILDRRENDYEMSNSAKKRKSANREPESKQMLDPKDRAWQKWQCIGCLTSGRTDANKQCLFRPLFLSLKLYEINDSDFVVATLWKSGQFGMRTQVYLKMHLFGRSKPGHPFSITTLLEKGKSMEVRVPKLHTLQCLEGNIS